MAHFNFTGFNNGSSTEKLPAFSTTNMAQTINGMEIEKGKQDKQIIDKLNEVNQSVTNQEMKLVTLSNNQVEILNNIRGIESYIKSLHNDQVHQYIKCACCGMDPIKGRRFKCFYCPNFNLCEPCERILGQGGVKIGDHDSFHTLLLVKDDELLRKEESKFGRELIVPEVYNRIIQERNSVYNQQRKF